MSAYNYTPSIWYLVIFYFFYIFLFASVLTWSRCSVCFIDLHFIPCIFTSRRILLTCTKYTIHSHLSCVNASSVELYRWFYLQIRRALDTKGLSVMQMLCCAPITAADVWPISPADEKPIVEHFPFSKNRVYRIFPGNTFHSTLLLWLRRANQFYAAFVCQAILPFSLEVCLVYQMWLK